MASSSTPSSSITTLPKKHEVFLSFRGEDTRHGFTSHLYDALCRKKIETFIDHDKLERGDEISPALFGAIRGSKIAVVIFSEDYASSKWCLRELAEIIECKKMNKLIVMPVFYKVDPSDVRKQTGSFERSFANYEEIERVGICSWFSWLLLVVSVCLSASVVAGSLCFLLLCLIICRFKKRKEKERRQWREALTEASNLSGWDSSVIRPDAKLVGEIVETVWMKLRSEYIPSSSDFEGLIEIYKRIEQFNDLQEYYLQKRRQLANQPHIKQENNKNLIHREGYNAGFADFQSVLTTFTRRLRVIAELRHGDLFHSADIVSSIEFDRDDKLFATASVSRRIKVFDFSAIVNEPKDVHCPVVEMSTHSKLSCLSWNKFSKNHIASSNYEGIVTVWDVTTQQSVMEYKEHEKRAWSVDFSCTVPSMLVSGGDDCMVKVWCTKQEASVLNIDMKANICCVKCNPGSSNYIAVGSADHHIHYYDLRNISQPLHVFTGHKKAVSYVKFLSNNELASASTDCTLRLWDVKDKLPVRTFRGHTNEQNFVGLTVNSEYITCGSETNEVYVYHKGISKPITWHRFGSPDVEDADEDAGSYFISAVCWKSDSHIMLTANSQGTIKVIVLAV